MNVRIKPMAMIRLSVVRNVIVILKGLKITIYNVIYTPVFVIVRRISKVELAIIAKLDIMLFQIVLNALAIFEVRPMKFVINRLRLVIVSKM